MQNSITDKKWALLQPYVPEVKPGDRPKKYPKREILNGIFYILRGGCAWRPLHHDFPPWQIVYHYFWLWRQDGTWQVVHDLFRGDVRAASGKRRQPRAGGDAGRDDPSDDSSPGSRRTLLNTL